MNQLTQQQTSEAIQYNRDRSYPEATWRAVQQAVGADVDGKPGPNTARQIAQFQRDNRLSVDGKLGRNTLSALGVDPDSGQPTAPRAEGSDPAIDSVSPQPVQPSPVAQPAEPGMAPITADKVPAGFRMVRSGKGLSRYSDQRLDRTLLHIREHGLIDLSDEDIDTLQRIANIEISGTIQGINTWIRRW